MGYIDGEEDIESSGSDPVLINAVYHDLGLLGGDELWGSTRFDSHGYMSGYDKFPDISVLQVKYPNIEFKIIPDPDETPGFHVDDTFGGDITVAYRLKGSEGWHLG